MKLYYYFSDRNGLSDLFFILKDLPYLENDESDLDIWKRKMGHDTHKIRIDTVEAKLIKELFKRKL